MPDLLLEIFSEEIPARMQAAAIEHLCNALRTGLKNDSITAFSTPRRLAVVIENLPVSQADITTELKGPKEGAPEVAMQGFLKKTGLMEDQLEKRDGAYFATVFQKGKPTAEAIKTLVEETLAAFPWPKSMRWGAGSTAWVRPLHSILCIFDGKVVPVEFAGVKAGNTTRGHRFLAGDSITIASAKDYDASMTKASVIASREARKAEILKQAEAAAAAQKLTLKKDDGLLEEVTGLVEFPHVLVGSIDAKFMDLPKEVLVSEMRAHQKYFALENADGSLADKFLITANMRATDGGKAIIAGNERVLRARLSDGRFFWDFDRKKSLADWAKGLASVTYHAKLGSIADKVARIAALAASIADKIGADKKQVARAAELAKADLVTGMVGEFPDLQGVMGRYYAVAAGEDAAVADAIRDHYKPQGPGDSVPSDKVAVSVALADKLDTLVSMFAIGEKPTGSKDPFALRRAALGVIRLILENDLRIKLGDFLNAELLAFFADRLKVQLKDSGIRHDVISAVIADGDDDLVRINARAKAVQDFLATEDGKNLLAGYKRAANILAIEEKKDNCSYSETVDSMLLGPHGSDEANLANALVQAEASIKADLKTETYTEAMRALSKLRAPVDSFFDKVMVNVEDSNIRINRLRLLASIKRNVDSIANFSLIEG